MAFKKGDPRINRKGRPKKGRTIPDLLRRIGDEIHDEETRVTKYEAMCQTAWEQAIKGDTSARTFIADRTEGKPIERIKQEVEMIQYDGKNAEEFVRSRLNKE